MRTRWFLAAWFSLMLLWTSSPGLAQDAATVAFLQRVMASIQSEDWNGVISTIRSDPQQAVQSVQLLLSMTAQSGDAEQVKAGLLYANIVGRVLELHLGLPQVSELLRSQGQLLPEESWNGTALARGDGAPPPPEPGIGGAVGRMQSATDRLMKLAGSMQQQMAQFQTLAQQADMAGRLEDYIAMGWVVEEFRKLGQDRPQLLQIVQEIEGVGAELARAGLDAGPMLESSRTLKQQIEANAILDEVMQIRMENAMGLHSQALREGDELLPRVREPEVKNLLLFGMIGAAARTGQPERMARYLGMGNWDDLEAKFVFGTYRLLLDVDRNPNLSPGEFLRSFQELWPLLGRIQAEIKDKRLSRPTAESAADLIWLAARMARRTSAGTVEAGRLQEVQAQALAELERQGTRTWNAPAMQGDALNPEWDTFLTFALLDARLLMAAEAREAGDYESARQQLDKVKAYLPQLEQKATELEPAARKVFAGAGVTPVVRRGFFSNIPARYYEQSGLLLESQSATGDPAVARQVRSLYDQAIAMYERSANSDNRLLVLMPRYALVAHLTGTPAETCLKVIQESLNASREKGLRSAIIQAYLALGVLKARTGQKAAAVADLQQGLKLLEELVTEFGGDSPAAATLKGQARSGYELLAQLQTEQGEVGEAMSVLGRMQQMSSNGSVSPTVAGNPRLAEALQQMRDSQIRLRSVEAEGETLRTAVPTAIQKEAMSSHQSLIAKTKAEFYDTLGQLYRLNPEFEKLAIRPVNFSRFQKSVPANALVVQYFPTATELYVFVVGKDSLKTRKIAVKREELEKMARDFRLAIVGRARGAAESNQGLEQASYALNKVLVEPLEEDLKGKEVLAVVPTGSLLYIPFSALARPGPGGKPEYLLERFQTVALVKSSDLDLLDDPVAGRADGPVIAFGNPDGTLASARLEVQAIQSLFPGAVVYLESQATKEAVGSVASKDVSYLHFATHGVLDTRDPRGTHLVMAGGEKGRLTVNEIAGLELGKDLRLVTLSACQTALGEREPRSELLQSMADAFGYAGSPSVVASLWKVSDDSTRELMEEFYRQLKAGQSRSRALQQASLKLAHDDRYSHPFFWSPFLLMGDWR
ncbi:MAG: CHAT domain-containing protein [Armatimonadetes bacterium]|nr:CHAT domain-containing protein [Armatimonadota bacterium]